MFPIPDAVQGDPCPVRFAAVGQPQMPILEKKVHQGERTDAVSAHEMIAHGNLHKIPAKSRAGDGEKARTIAADRKGRLQQFAS